MCCSLEKAHFHKTILYAAETTVDDNLVHAYPVLAKDFGKRVSGRAGIPTGSLAAPQRLPVAFAHAGPVLQQPARRAVCKSQPRGSRARPRAGIDDAHRAMARANAGPATRRGWHGSACALQPERGDPSEVLYLPSLRIRRALLRGGAESRRMGCGQWLTSNRLYTPRLSGQQRRHGPVPGGLASMRSVHGHSRGNSWSV